LKQPPTQEERELKVERRRSIWTLLGFTMLFPELISGSTPITGFLNPITPIMFVLAYGLPILLIREVAVRFKVGTTGLIFFGVAYAVQNEGLMARTLIVNQHLPIDSYDHYGYFASVSFPWFAFIGCWHALCSVLFPITFVQFAHPKTADKPWLKGSLSVVLGAGLVVLSSWIFLQPFGTLPAGQPAQLAVLLALMAGLFGLGFAFKGSQPKQAHLKPETLKAFGLGFTQFVVFFLLAGLAGAKVVLPLFILMFAYLVFFYARMLRIKGWFSTVGIMAFGVGMYTSYGLFAALFWLKNPVVDLIDLGLNTWILLILWRQCQRGVEPPMPIQAQPA
jgi:hypothetical protein